MEGESGRDRTWISIDGNDIKNVLGRSTLSTSGGLGGPADKNGARFVQLAE